METSNPMKVRIKIDNLFSDHYFSSPQDFKEMPDDYVGNVIDDAEIAKWLNYDFVSDFPPLTQWVPSTVFISAQTGRGKNHFVQHNLRGYAKRNGDKKILYLSNRVALNAQQKAEFNQIMDPSHRYKYNQTTYESWENVTIFDNVTVITYQSLLDHLSRNPDDWANSFSYVVIDEAHFFYSDAFFNSNTWYILEQIITRFPNAVHIYMSATLDDVLEPIRYLERKHRKRPVHVSLPASMAVPQPLPTYGYYFPRDYSAYTYHSFSSQDQIIEKITSPDEPKRNKWLIFVTSKQVGRNLAHVLNKNTPGCAVYHDSSSRRSSDMAERMSWICLKEQGRFERKVLITTSVLDNGFSIKDKNIKNIVIFSHDKTEFLQELGRCRLEKGQTIDLYASNISAHDHANRKNQHKSLSETILWFCGNTVDLQPSYPAKPDPLNVILSLWHPHESSERALFRLIPNGDGALFPVLNDMARWRTMQLGRQIEDYEAYQEEHGEKVASSTYKLSWFDGKPPKSAEDLDSIDNKNLTNNMIAFLNRYVTHATPMKEGSDEFNAFSSQLKSYFKQLNPGDPSISRSKKRKEWGHASINNHLKPFNTDTGNCYELVEEPLKNTWVLKNRINEQTSSE